MFEHDPLCHAAAIPEYADFSDCGPCALFRKARADEREKAVRRIAAFMDSDPVKGETWDEFFVALITAVRGES